MALPEQVLLQLWLAVAFAPFHCVDTVRVPLKGADWVWILCVPQFYCVIPRGRQEKLRVICVPVQAHNLFGVTYKVPNWVHGRWRADVPKLDAPITAAAGDHVVILLAPCNVQAGCMHMYPETRWRMKSQQPEVERFNLNLSTLGLSIVDWTPNMLKSCRECIPP